MVTKNRLAQAGFGRAQNIRLPFPLDFGVFLTTHTDKFYYIGKQIAVKVQNLDGDLRDKIKSLVPTRNLSAQAVDETPGRVFAT